MTFLSILVASLIIVTVTTATTTVKAVTTNNNNLVTYDNPKFGIKIQYPAGWAKEITDDEFGKDVMFLVPGSPIKYAEKLDISILDNQTGKSLNSIISDLIKFNKHENTALQNYKVIESTPTVVNGINANRLVNTYSDSKFGNVKSMQINMLKGDKLYTILYTSDPGKYETLLPTIQKMIDSFQIK